MPGSPRIPTFTIASLLLALAGSGLAAQQPGAPGQYDAGRAREGEQQRHRRPTISDDQLEGPPYPQFVTMRFELDSTESGGYQQLYDSFMVATKPLRDSARAAMGTHHGLSGTGGYHGGEAGGARGGNANADQLEQLGNELTKQENQFDKRVKKVFSSAHYKDYKQWKDDQRKQAEELEQQARPREPSQ
ncbi:MAG TPA: hypothetical protein VMH88_12715 [Gemmatimonadales bacterium]|nr:hypothetical protein [Gemmatimonadales bacterium]